MSDILANGPALIAWAAVLYKLSSRRRSPDDPAVHPYLWTLVALASALTVLSHPVYVTLDRLAGIPNLARLLGHSFIMLTAWNARTTLSYVNYPFEEAQSRVRRHGAILVVALVFMVVLFALAPVDEETIQFMSMYATAPFILEYWLVFLGFLGVALFDIVRLDLAHAARADNPALKLGLRTVALGGIVGLGYVANEGLYVLGAQINATYPLGDKDIVTTVLVAGGTSLMIIGSTMPAWGPKVGILAAARWLDRYRTLRALYPLWTDLCRVSPEIALAPPSSSLTDALSLRDLNIRLYRRVVEIRDGLLTLRQYVDSRVREDTVALGRSAGYSGDELDVVAEAATVAAAIRAKEQGRAMVEGDVVAAAPADSDLGAEAAYLTRLSRAYRSSPVVRTMLDRADQADSDGGLISQGTRRS
ncbi:MAG: MAB_1171c family putative transporter [Chloroflexota bacterium]